MSFASEAMRKIGELQIDGTFTTAPYQVAILGQVPGPVSRWGKFHELLGNAISLCMGYTPNYSAFEI